MDEQNDVVSANEDSESDTDIESTSDEVESLLSTISGIANPDKLEEAVKEEVKVATEPPANSPPAATPDPAKPDNDRGLERLAAKEKEIRELRESFEKERSQYLKFEELNKNPSAVLEKVGIDPDVLMKTILYERLPDGNPVKEKLETELSKILTDKKINALREEMAAKDRQAKIAEANAKNYHETVQKIETYTTRFKDADDKTLPNVSTIGRGDAGVLKELIIEEMINDAAQRYVRNDEGDPISHEEAASRIEKRLARLVPLINKLAETNNKGSNSNASGTVVKKKTMVRPGPAQAKVQGKLTPQQEMDNLIANVLSGKI